MAFDGTYEMRLLGVIKNFPKYTFLFEELVKRDFQQKYKRTTLGMAWSVLSPLLTLMVMKTVFERFFGRSTAHYTIYVLSGNIVMAYFREATRNGMGSLISNAGIITKMNVPKYLFLLSKNVSALVNFFLTLVVFFVFCIIDRVSFGLHMFLLIYPIFWLLIMNIGIGMILSALYVFFRDIQYLYDVFLTLLTYLSAIFYTIERFNVEKRRLFLLNPVYVVIKYFRVVVIDGKIPSLQYHALCMLYGMLFLSLGCIMYRKYNQQFIYYL